MTMPEGAQILGADAYWSEDSRLERMQAVLSGAGTGQGSLLACVAPMMIALDWFGSPRTLTSLVPDAGGDCDLSAFSEFLAEQGFALRAAPYVSDNTLFSALPAGSLLQAEDGRYAVYIGELEGRAYVHDGTGTLAVETFGPVNAVYSVTRMSEADVTGPAGRWTQAFTAQNLREPLGILSVSAFINLLALSVSLFTMVVYNLVIPSGSVDTLTSLVLLAVVAISGGWALRLGRMRAMSRFGSWTGYKFSSAALGRTLGLAYDVSSRIGVNQTLVRFRSIESVRGFLSGPAGTALVDAPFVVIFIVVIALIGGWIALIPVFGLALMVAIVGPMTQYVEEASRRAGRTSTELMEMTATIIANRRGAKALGDMGLWQDRYARLAAEAAAANRDFAGRTGMMQAVGHALSLSTVLLTMVVGIFLVLNGVMNTGGLIAAMMLVWRITGPAEQAFTSTLQRRQVRAAAGQMDRLMATPGEQTSPQLLSPVDHLSARLQADRLMYRYSADHEPALNGVSFEAEPGDVIAVIGPNGAGKSTLLECLAGLRSPQAGTFRVGGRDVRQFDPADFRSWIGFATRRPQAFPETVRAHMRLKRPESTDAELEAALEAAGGADWSALMPTGLETPIDPFDETSENERRERLVNMAIALLGAPRLLLFDDPVLANDGMLNSRFEELLANPGEDRTVMFASHRPELIRLASKVLVLDHGNVVHFGPVAEDSETNPESDSA